MALLVVAQNHIQMSQHAVAVKLPNRFQNFPVIALIVFSLALSLLVGLIIKFQIVHLVAG